MPFAALAIGVIIIILLVLFAIIFGGMATVRHGPDPSEGSDEAH